MKKQFLTSVIMIFMLICGCASPQKETRYKKFIKAIDYAYMVNYVDADAYKVVFTKEELNILKGILLKNSNDLLVLSEIYYDASRNSQQGYHLMFLYDEQKDRVYPMMYSIQEEAIKLREKDIFPEIELKLPEISILKIKISKEMVEIFRKYESTFPQNILYKYSWPVDYEALRG